MSASISLAVALDGAGWHPAAWREPDAHPGSLFSGRYWRDLARTAENGAIDLVTIEDSVGLQGDGFRAVEPRAGRVTGRLDALLLASWLAPLTTRIGLVPTITTTHTEPFHVSTGVASLDYASHGRAGWRVQVSGRPDEAELFGRRTIPSFDPTVADDRSTRVLESLFGEADDAIEVVRGLWDSWEDDAEIRDIATGRFLDNGKVHSIHFSGEHFAVRGPSITPRPPQGQPPVFVLAHQTVPYRLAASQADIVFVTPHDDAQVDSIIAEVRDAERFVHRDGIDGHNDNARHIGVPLQIWADVVVAIDDTTEAATARLTRLDESAGVTYASDAAVFAGSASRVAERLLEWRARGIQGFRLRPLALPRDLVAITEQLVPVLRSAGALARDADARDLRGRLGLPPAANRFAVPMNSVAP